jgi:hypothetical protein
MASSKKHERDRYTWYWRMPAFVFVGLSLDEAVSLHEKTMKPLRSIFRAEGFLSFPWVVLGMAFLCIFSLAYLRFFVNLPPERHDGALA